MTENMKDWDALRTPPGSALKEIKGGRLSGKSDINPQWRWQRMTEVFGPIGTGWCWEHVEHWTERGAQEQVMCFVRVAVRVKRGGEWSERVFGTGGSFLVEQESKGPHTNDEGYKMAETDALGNACKYLGLAADVFLGQMDGSKYAREKAGMPAVDPSGYDPKAAEKARSPAAPAAAGLLGTDFKDRMIPNPDRPECPVCNGAMWDNREPERGGKSQNPKRSPKMPDFKCRDKECDGVYWPLRSERKPTAKAQAAQDDNMHDGWPAEEQPPDRY